MLPEHQRQERFTTYAHLLRERFQSGILAELQPLNQWVVWNGGNTNLISQLRRSTARSVRMHRQDALSKLEQLGFETVQGVLTGKYPTLALAQERGQAR